MKTVRTFVLVLLALSLTLSGTGPKSLALEPPPASPGPRTTLPDFSGIPDVQARKRSFFQYLLPLVENENRKLAARRLRLTYIQDHIRFGRPLLEQDSAWLAGVIHKYDLPVGDIHAPEFWRTALARVDTLPLDLVLVQAAIESAWGTSRFAREGLNLFGQWCFRPGCGMVPDGRPEGESYEVARFPTVSASIASYMHNLNSGAAYSGLRSVRLDLTLRGEPAGACDLVGGLTQYSQRGGDYVDELRAMIRVNQPVIAQARDKTRQSGKI